VAPAGPDLDEYRAAAARALAGAPEPGDEDRLFSADAVRALAGRPALARFAAEGHLRAASAESMARVGARAGELRDLDAALAAEPDAERRGELWTERRRIMESGLADALAEARERRAEAARALDAPTAAALLARAAGLDLARTAAGGARVLDATEDALARGLAGLASEALGTPDPAAADLPRLARAPHVGELAAGDARALVETTSEGLGLAGRPLPRALDAPGPGPLAESLRAAGIALAEAGAGERLTLEHRRLGDPALRLAHGVLLEGLPADVAWGRRVVGTPDPERLARAAAVVRLLATRAAAARAVALAGEAPAGIMSRALGVEWPEQPGPGDDLAGLQAADDLRARALAAALRSHLREAHGERWFADERSGALLAELWLEGGALEARALARELGAPGLDPDAAAADATEGLD
jgi:hypothetical protein